MSRQSVEITTVPQYGISNHHRFDALVRVRIVGRMPLFVKFVVTRFIRGSVVIIHNSQKKNRKKAVIARVPRYPTIPSRRCQRCRSETSIRPIPCGSSSSQRVGLGAIREGGYRVCRAVCVSGSRVLVEVEAAIPELEVDRLRGGKTWG
jgi:hypothetical protein